MTRLAILVVLGALLAGGCGPSAEEVVSQTASRLDRIQSATLSLRVAVTRPHEPGGVSGYQLSGPFSLSASGPLPAARLQVKQLAASGPATATLISTGRRAFARLGTKTYEVPGWLGERIRGMAEALRSRGGLGQLRLAEWLEEPELSGGTEVGGARTDRITAGVDPARALGDVLALGRQGGGGAGLPGTVGPSAARLRRS
ncbi:MAG: hypothetical protein M3133_10785, partial [Actinomycetota bacterium]|nr:hypothetical protein [Actinomycetota bacterium]